MAGRRTIFNFIGFSPSGNDVQKSPNGGIVLRFKGAGTLNVGDAVYFTANADEVDKNTAQANYATYAGQVVGGKRTFDEIVVNDLVAGGAIATIQACQAGEDVLVQIEGIALGISSAAIASGQRVLAENLGTAGRLVAGTTAGLMLGHTVGATTGANQWQKFLIGQR